MAFVLQAGRVSDPESPSPAEFITRAKALCSFANTYHHIENASKNRPQQGLRMLLSSERESLPGVLDHLAHLAHAFGALRLALVAGEDIARTHRAGLDGRSDIALAQTVAVTDVQRSEPDRY
jgi:hypothetical protein